MHSKRTDNRYGSLLIVLMAFLLIGAALFIERSGVKSNVVEAKLSYLPGKTVTARQSIAEVPTTCLVLSDSTDNDSKLAIEQLDRILLDMKVGYCVSDVMEKNIPEFSNFQTVIVLMSDLSHMGDSLMELCQWVKDGGRVLFAITIQKNSYLDQIENKLGIVSSGHENASVDSVFPDPDFMLGGGESFVITDGYESALKVNLSEKAKIHAYTSNEQKLPLIWENAYGDGKFVVMNMGVYEKSTRGFFAAAYSLLEDVCVYPVINGSCFFLDDFLAPIPGGEWEFIQRDYQMDLVTFYKTIWLPDIQRLAEKYGVKFTGVIIENYQDDTSGMIQHSRDIIQYQYFGNMLLRFGGELGFHGHNHQPLCLENTNYGEDLPYKTWESYDAMKSSLIELLRFTEECFPGVDMSVYVPPSNILSQEGRKMIGEEFPQIKTIASLYFPDDQGYEQEYEVAEDGVAELPRTMSECILSDYMKLVALSELNMHYMNSHFFHPDDVLDVERGAEYGWAVLRDGIDEYMNWIYSSAPDIRNLTGSEGGAAVQRFSAVNVKKNVKSDKIELDLNHFYDEAFLMVRINEGRPGTVSGGKLEHLTGDLYMLQAYNKHVEIERLRE